MEGLKKVYIDSFKAYGHRNISATHPSTLEITKDPYLTPTGNCIIAVKSEKACADLSEDVRRAIMNDRSIIKIKLSCDGEKDEILARGSSKLTLKSPMALIVRKSKFICDKTLAIRANKSAKDLSRKLVRKLKEGKELKVEIIVCLGEAKCLS